MDYIRQLNAWGVESLKAELPAGQQAMYMRLLMIINKVSRGKEWPEWVPIGRKQLARELRITLRTVTTWRQELEAKGFIKTRKPKDYTECMLFHIVKLYNDQKEKGENRDQNKKDLMEARESISRYPAIAGKLLGQMVDVMKISEVEAAKMIEEYGIEICQEILPKVKKNAKKSPKNYFVVVVNKTLNDRKNATPTKKQSERERQKRQVLTPPPAANEFDTKFLCS